MKWRWKIVNSRSLSGPKYYALRTSYLESIRHWLLPTNLQMEGLGPRERFKAETG